MRRDGARGALIEVLWAPEAVATGASAQRPRRRPDGGGACGSPPVRARAWLPPALALALLLVALAALRRAHLALAPAALPALPWRDGGGGGGERDDGVSVDDGGACVAAVRSLCGAAFSRAARLALALHVGACERPHERALRGHLATAARAPPAARASLCAILNDLALAELDPKSSTPTLTKPAFMAAAHALAEANGGSFALHAAAGAAHGALLGRAGRYDFHAAASPSPFPWPPAPGHPLLLSRPGAALAALRADGVAPLLRLSPAAVRRVVDGVAGLEFVEKDHVGPGGPTYPPVRGIRPDKAAPESTFYILRDSGDALRVPALAQLVFDRRLLALAQDALGVAPILARVDVWWTRGRTRHRGAAPHVRDFHQFHRDFNFIRSVKLFCYLSDVPDADHGPYEYVAASHGDTGGLPAPRIEGEFYDEAAVRAAFPAPGAVRQVTGAAGTVFMAASTVLHRGGPLARGAHRAMLQWEFAASLLGGTDGGLVVPPMRLPAALAPALAAYPRLFARVKAGYLSLMDGRPLLGDERDGSELALGGSSSPPSSPTVVFATLAFRPNATAADSPFDAFRLHAASFLDVTVPALRAYAARHGYALVVHSSAKPFLPPRRTLQTGWAKMAIVRDALDAHPTARWAAWIDADTLPLDYDARVEPFLEAAEAAGKHVVLHPQCGVAFGVASRGGNGSAPMSSALVFIRNTDRGRGFLDLWRSRALPMHSATCMPLPPRRPDDPKRNEETDDLNVLVRWFNRTADAWAEGPIGLAAPNTVMTWASRGVEDAEATRCYTGRCFPARPWLERAAPAAAAAWDASPEPVFVTFPDTRKEQVAPFAACRAAGDGAEGDGAEDDDDARLLR